MDEQIELVSRHLTEKNIKLLALDFDVGILAQRTFIDIHTGGRFKGSAVELLSSVRSVFKKLVPSVHSHGLSIAIVTFSSQKELIGELMNMLFPNLEIPVVGFLGEPARGKLDHLSIVMEHLNTVNPGINLNTNHVLLIDDDKKNIRIANHNRFNAITYFPDEKHSELLLLRHLLSC